jgi:type 2A phosphatase activator TIP41
MAHQSIQMPQHQQQQDSSNKLDGIKLSDPSYQGVQVLESSDAALWKQRQQQTQQNNTYDNEQNLTMPPNVVDQGTIRNTQFHYDWTYSTPFIGSVFVSGIPATTAATMVDQPLWESLSQSGMPMYLLTDTSIPILYYDHIVLYEDDLHDNGEVQYSIKVRIMPHCAYVLARLFVRVDYVLIRLREVRWLVEFDTTEQKKDDPKNPPEPNKIYRDVTWREVSWIDLGPTYQLPTQVQAWTMSDGTTRETPAFQMLLSKIPQVDLPSGMIAHAQMCYTKSNG